MIPEDATCSEHAKRASAGLALEARQNPARRAAGQRLALDYLPELSPWPQRLVEGPVLHGKTRPEILREYENEKWGRMWEHVRKSRRPMSLDEIEPDIASRELRVFSRGEQLWLARPQQIQAAYLRWVGSELKRWMPAPALMELGAGYGGVILRLARKRWARSCRVMAGELTVAGRDLLRYFAPATAKSVEIGACDLASAPVTTLPCPEGAVIFTSFAMMYLSTVPRQFVDWLGRFRPRVVVHFEPCLEHISSNRLLGLLRRSYIGRNDYNRDLVGVLRRAEREKKIEILREERAVFGANPLLPASLLCWRPRMRG